MPRQDSRDLPTRPGPLIEDGHLCAVREESHILLEGVHGNQCGSASHSGSQKHLTSVRRGKSRRIHDASTKNGQHIGGNLRGTCEESTNIRRGSDLRIGLRSRAADLFHDRLLDNGHVVSKGLFVGDLAIAGGNDEFATVNVGQLRTVAVLAAHGLLLGLIVIGRCEQVTEDEFGNHHFVLRMNGDGNAFAVIVNHDLRRRHSDHNPGHPFFFFGDGRHARHVIQRVHDELIEDLEETRIECDIAKDHAPRLSIVDPSALDMGIAGADVSIGQLKNMFALRKLLIAFRYRFN